MSGRKLPLAMIDKCIGSRLWVIMKGYEWGLVQFARAHARLVVARCAETTHASAPNA